MAKIWSYPENDVGLHGNTGVLDVHPSPFHN